jgi:predicted nucleotidyltransferase
VVDEAIKSAVRNYLRTLEGHGIVVTRGIVFGSQATGKAGPWSDIDVLVVSPRFDAAHRREDFNLLRRIAARTDSRIEPLPCGENQWLEDDVSSIIEVARREGEEISIRG